MSSLVPWSGVLVAAVATPIFHRNPQAIALDMVVAVGAALALSLATAGPSLLAPHLSTSPETGGRPRLLLLNWRDGEHRRAGGSELYAERVAEA